jgi:hypothetical protein
MAWMPLSCCWYDMNAAFMSYASECDKNHRSQELARDTLAPGAEGRGTLAAARPTSDAACTWHPLAFRDDLYRADRALAAAEDQVPAAQQVFGTRDRLLVHDLLVVQVGAACCDGTARRGDGG